MEVVKRTWTKVLAWTIVLGVITTLIGDWGEWDRMPVNLIIRLVIVAIGAIVGLILNYFTGNYIGMGTSVIESMGITKFSSDSFQKIENSFIFVGAFVGAIIAIIFVK